MSNLQFKWEFTVLEIHLDTFGHMNHATYIQLFEQARWEFVRERGYGLDVIQKSQKGPIILDLKVRYKRELRLSEKVTVISETIDYKSKLGRVKQVMLNSKGEEACEIELTVGFFDMKHRMLIPPTPEWLSAVGVESSK